MENAMPDQALSWGNPNTEADTKRFREALGQFATGVTIITTRTRTDEDLGMTVSSFNTVSLKPPLVLFCIDKRAYSLPGWLTAGHFAVNILAEGQDWLANQFATALEDKWANVRFERGEGGVPLLAGTVAHFECRGMRQIDGGDHVVFLIRVLRYRVFRGRSPLVFCQGRYNNLRPGPMAPPDWPLAIHY